MKKNRSHGFQKSNLIAIFFTLISAILGGLISAFSFLPNMVENIAKSEQLVSIYNDTSYDYILSGLNEESFSTISNISSIDEYAEFYNAISVINTKEGEADVYIRSLVDDTKLELTEYTSKRIIKEMNTSSEEVYVSETFANSYSVSLGDVFKIAGMNFIVSRIYRDSNDITILYVPNFQELFFQKFSQNLSVSGMYIKCVDKNSFYSQIKDIEGIIIQDKMLGFEEKNVMSKELKEAVKSDFILFGILSGGIYLMGAVVYLIIFNKKIKKELVDKGNRELILKANYSNGIGGLAIVAFATLSMFISTQNAKLHITFTSMFSQGYTSLIIMICFVLIALLMHLIFIKSTYRNISNSRKNKK